MKPQSQPAASSKLPQPRPMLSLVLACVFVSVPFVATKPILGHVPAMPLLLVQVVASAVTLSVIAALMGRLPRLPRDWRLGLPGLMQPGIAHVLFFFGLERVSASVEGLLTALEAVVVALIAWPLLGERPTARVIAALVSGVAGLLMLGFGAGHDGMTSIIGLLLVMGAVLCAASDTVLTRHLAQSSDPLAMTVLSQWYGMAVVAPIALISAPLTAWSAFLEPRLLVTMVLVGIAGHGMALFMFNYALSQLPAAFAASLFPLISLFTAIGGVFLLGETLSPVQIAGGACVVGSALLVVWCVRRRETKAFEKAGKLVQ